MAIYELDGVAPELPADGEYFVADSAVLIGKVRLGRGANIWFGAVLRGDEEQIEIGEGSNVQDNSVVHADPGYPATIGRDCTIGHNVIIHGCLIGDRCLIGMGAIVMNGAKIGDNCIVGAGAIVTEGKEFPPGSLIIGAPAKVVRALDETMMSRLDHGGKHYAANGIRYRKGLKRIG